MYFATDFTGYFTTNAQKQHSHKLSNFFQTAPHITDSLVITVIINYANHQKISLKFFNKPFEESIVFKPY